MGDQRPIGREIDQCRKNTAMGIATLWVHHPLFPPGCGQFDAFLIHLLDAEPQPLMERPKAKHLLDVSGCQFLCHCHSLDLVFRSCPDQGVTTTLPMTSRSWIMRRPSIA